MSYIDNYQKKRPVHYKYKMCRKHLPCPPRGSSIRRWRWRKECDVALRRAGSPRRCPAGAPVVVNLHVVWLWYWNIPGFETNLQYFYWQFGSYLLKRFISSVWNDPKPMRGIFQSNCSWPMTLPLLFPGHRTLAGLVLEPQTDLVHQYLLCELSCLCCFELW